MTARFSRTKLARLAAVMALVIILAPPLSSAYLNSEIDMTEYTQEKSCYCHQAQPDPDVDIIIDVATQVAYTPANDSVEVSIGILGTPDNLTGFGLFLNASEDATGVQWDTWFKNESIEWPDATVQGVLWVNGTSMWTIDDITSPWFNVSFIPGQTDQDIVLSVTGMRADDSGNETGDRWNAGEVTIEVRRERLVSVSVGITNEEIVSVLDVLVDFYVDGEYIGNDTVDQIAPGMTENATAVWDATFAKEGEHELRAVIDPEGTVTETDKSNNEIVRTIWLGGPPEPEDLTLYYGLGGIGIGLVVIVTVFWFWRRRQYRF
jgi:hypothetical protein